MSLKNVPSAKRAVVMAGIPDSNSALYRSLRFSVGDPVALIKLDLDHGSHESILILRDIEMERARRNARVDHVACPADFPPAKGLSGDRETATAQAAAECLRRAGVQHVTADRTLPLIYAEIIRQAAIDVQCDTELGVLQRRSKDAQEVEWLRQAQRTTEGAVRLACEMIATAKANSAGILTRDGSELTSERVRAAVDLWLLERGFTNPAPIVAGGPAGADCHNIGSGPLYTEQPVIVDIFPRNRQTRYYGDCTRTVVHGTVSELLNKMHAAVVAAKASAIAATRAGVTGQEVHAAATGVIARHGFQLGLPSQDAADDYCAMTHGTGHGVGLDVHEPPLLDENGPELVVGDALTIEPGLYAKSLGGIRVEDMVVVSADGCENLNQLQEGLSWS